MLIPNNQQELRGILSLYRRSNVTYQYNVSGNEAALFTHPASYQV